MKVIIKQYDCLCELKEFTINGISADYDDFGEKYDTDRINAPEYGCGNMQFIPKASTEKVLSQYQITQSEYDEICDKLESALSFGQCGWCI